MPRSPRFFAPVMTVMMGLTFLALITGCARSRGVDRAKVLEAENINQRQKLAALQDQLRQGHLAQDGVVAREQQLRAELVAARQDAAAAQAARAQALQARDRLATTQSELNRRDAELAEANRRYEELMRQRVRQPAPRVVADTSARRPAPVRTGGISPEAEAMRRDLQRQLSAYGVRDMNVEVRRERSGEERVAIVLPDAFPAGKATLAYNASAVKAVISVGKMIRSHYPKSEVLIEGHTDSDPIRKSGWGTNENLSRARAKAVMTLLTNSGIDASSVTTQGVGANRPLAMGNTKRAKSRNRRVEIFITPRS